MKRYKKLTIRQRERIQDEVQLMLAAHRDGLWNRWNTGYSNTDPKRISVCCTEGFYGEAFGIMRGLKVLGYGYFGSTNLSAVEERKSTEPYHNLQWWFDEITKDYLTAEGFYDKRCSAEICEDLLKSFRILTA